VNNKEFTRIRHYLGKSQSKLAQLLCISPKAVQSFEQGWRNIPASVERQLLFLLSRKISPNHEIRPCWELQECPVERRDRCPAWEYKLGNACWFITGTQCSGDAYKDWEEKIKLCQRCKYYVTIGLQGKLNKLLVDES